MEMSSTFSNSQAFLAQLGSPSFSVVIATEHSYPALRLAAQLGL